MCIKDQLTGKRDMYDWDCWKNGSTIKWKRELQECLPVLFSLLPFEWKTIQGKSTFSSFSYISFKLLFYCPITRENGIIWGMLVAPQNDLSAYRNAADVWKYTQGTPFHPHVQFSIELRSIYGVFHYYDFFLLFRKKKMHPRMELFPAFYK